jgi:hypothetical protein
MKKAVIDLSNEEIKILYFFKTFHYLTELQVRKLYPFKSRSFCYRKLQRLLEEHYLTVLVQKKYPSKEYKPVYPYVYLLDTIATDFLRDQGVDMTGYFPSLKRKRANIFIDHLLETNDVLISAKILPRICPTITDVEILHDLTIRQMYTTGSRPDGLVIFRTEKEYIPLWIEVDRATEDTQIDFRKKIRDIFYFIRNGQYQRIFGMAEVTVVFLTGNGENRINQMLKWTEAELTALGEMEEADLFRFGESIDDPIKLFTTPMHKIPFTQMFTSLI